MSLSDLLELRMPACPLRPDQTLCETEFEGIKKSMLEIQLLVSFFLNLF